MIPEGWKTYKLGDVANVIDCLHQTPKYSDHGHPMVRVTDIKGGYLKLRDCLLVDDEVYNEFSKNHKAELGDIVFARVGSYGITSYVKEDVNFCLGQNTAFISSVGIDSRYLFYYLNSTKGKQEIEGFVTGTTQKTISLKSIKSIEIDAPISKNQQSHIASILSSLDDKIEHNLQMNKTLESIAKTIFKEWFVDFRFPGFDGEWVGGLPKGWKRKSFKDLLVLLKDGSHNPPQRVNEGIRFIAGATDIKDLYIQFDKCTYITKADYNKIHKNWEVKANDLLITIVGTIGNTAIVREGDLPFSLQRSIAVLRPIAEISHLFIYQIIKSKDFINYLRSRTNPTGQPGIYLGTLSEFKTIVPPNQIMKRFHEIQSPLFEKMMMNITENHTLMGIRDSILPKLMTGKIRVA